MNLMIVSMPLLSDTEGSPMEGISGDEVHVLLQSPRVEPAMARP